MPASANVKRTRQIVHSTKKNCFWSTVKRSYHPLDQAHTIDKNTTRWLIKSWYKIYLTANYVEKRVVLNTKSKGDKLESVHNTICCKAAITTTIKINLLQAPSLKCFLHAITFKSGLQILDIFALLIMAEIKTASYGMLTCLREKTSLELFSKGRFVSQFRKSPVSKTSDPSPFQVNSTSCTTTASTNKHQTHLQIDIKTRVGYLPTFRGKEMSND